MRVYANLPVEMTYQSFGNKAFQWALILRGMSENIELAFNGLYNWGATDGELSYNDHTMTVGIVWTGEARMFHFFTQQAVNKLLDYYERKKVNLNKWKGVAGGQFRPLVKALTQRKINALKRSHEIFFSFQKDAPDPYFCGQITAERPDSDMKDEILKHAFNF